MKDMITPPGQNPAAAPAPGPAAPKSFSIVDLKQYFHIVVKRIWLVALCFVIALGVMVVMLVREVPVYRSGTNLLLSRGLDLPVSQKEVELISGADFIQTQLRIMNSGLIMQRARERMRRPAAEVRDLLVGVSINPVWRTSIISVVVTSYDPLFSAAFANAIADVYLEFKAEERMTTSQSTVISLTQQANRIRDELQRAEGRVLAYERENRIIAISDRGNIAAQSLATLSAKAAGYRTEKMLLEAQQPMLTEASDDVILATLASPIAPMITGTRPSIVTLGGESPSPSGSQIEMPRGPESLIEYGVIQRPNWQEQRKNKARYEAELVDLRTRFRDAHPLIQQKLRDIEEASRELDVELQFALRQYYSNLESLDIQYKAARRAEQAWEEEAIEVARKAHEYENLKRGVTRLQRLYDLVFQRLKEVDITIGIEPETVQILERAQPPSSPAAPLKVRSIFLAALIGLGVGLGLVFGLEFIDDSLRYPEEVVDQLGLKFFGVIPAANWDPDDLRSHMLSNLDQKSGLSEAYRNVRSAYLFGSGAGENKTIVVTSAVPREGKTTTCLNIGVSLAQAGDRVLLVDGDLRRGELHKFFGLEGGRGLSDILTGQAKPESVIQRTGIPNLDMVATGPFPSNPAELMLRPELRNFMEYASRSYDRILFDAPPVMAVSEAGILASQVDGVIFVIWAGQTSRKLSQLSVQVLRERGANILGAVLNNLEFGRVGYYYYSTYYGYYNYDYRYDRDRTATT